VVLAQDTTPTGQPANPPTTPTGQTTNPPTTPRGNNTASSTALTNPLRVDSLEALLQAILQIVIVLATPIVVLFIILAGFKYVTARGDVAKTKEATLALTYAIIGGILIIGAVAISQIIGNLVAAFS
jgi:hypothetical protein